MHNNNTTTIIARGCQWCQTCLYNWGDAYDEEGDRLGEAVRATFHGACKRLGREDIYWMPATSEVQALAECDPNDRSRCYAGLDGGRPHLALDELRDACVELVEELTDVLLDEEEHSGDLSDRLALDEFIVPDEGEAESMV